MCAQKPEGLRP